MPYSIRLPDGTLVENIPDSVTPEAAKARILQSRPELASQERTWGEAAKDIGAGLVTGVGGLVQLPGQLYGLATGDFSDTGTLGAGKKISEFGEEMKSTGLKARQAAANIRAQEAEKEGQVAAFLSSLGDTIKDPALLTNFLAEQAPQLIPMILSGVGVGALAARGAMSAAAARGAAVKAAEKVAAKKAAQAGTTAAIQTGAVMQGADVGAGAYDEIYKELRAKGLSEEQASAETINKARLAGVTGYALSVLANRYLPGGKALEEVLAGKKLTGNRLGSAAVTGLKEIPGENIEEVGGRVAQNVAAQAAGLDRDLMAGTGQTAAMATIGAAGMGGGAGLLAGRKQAPAPAEKPDETQQQSTETTQAAPPPAAPEDETASLGSFFEEKKPAPATPNATVAGMQAEYDQRDAEIKELEARGVTLTNKERGVLTGKRNKNRQLKAKIDNEIAKTATQGEANVAGPDQTAGGAGASVPAQPADELPATEGVESPKRDGVVPAGPDVAVPAQGETGKPVAVSPEEKMRAKTDEYLQDVLDDVIGMFDDAEVAAAKAELARRKATQPTGETLGTQAPQTQQAKTQGQEAPAAPVTATTRKTKLDADEAFLDSLLGKEDELPSRGTAAATPEQQKIDAKVDGMAADYGLVRMQGETTTDLAKRLKRVAAERRAAEQEFTRRTTEGGEPVAAIEDELLAKQSLVGKKPTRIPAEQQEMYEEMREGFNQEVEDETRKLPAFDKLTPDEKAKYFQENISRNSWDEHERAVQSLADYLESKRSASEEATRTSTKEGKSETEAEKASKDARELVRARDSYQRERETFSRKSGIAYQLPTWSDLSEESQRAYATINKTDTALEQDMAFRAVKRQVQKEQEEERSRLGLEEAERRSAQEMEAAAERARASQPGGSKKGEGKGAILPLNVLKMLARGDISGVLNYLNTEGRGLEAKTARMLGQGKVKIRDTVAQKVFRALAGALANVEGLKVNVVFDRNMVYDQLARYDAKTNTLYIGPNGLDEVTILHELLHAATVKIIHQFFTDKTKLDARQIAAVEQIQTIASYAKRIMGSRFPNAFENLYEFVAYALTDLDFQNELSKAQVPGLARATAKTEQQAKALSEIAPEAETERGLGRATEPPMLFDTLWDAFTGTLAWMYKLFRPEQKQTKILLPTEKTRVVGKRDAGEKKIKPVVDKEQRELTAQEREVLAPETLFDDPEAEANEATIPPEPGEMVIERGVTNLQRAILREPGYKGNLLLEVAAAVQQIMEAPEGGIEALAGKETVSSELYAKTPKSQQTKKAPPQDNSVEAILSRNELPELSSVSNLRKHWTGRKAYNFLKKKFQNSRDPIKRIEDATTLAGKSEFSGPKINTVYNAIVRASGIARDLFLTRVEPASAELRQAINEYAKQTKQTVEKATRDLHVIFMAMHEPERRAVKYMLNVPLSTAKTSITLPNGQTVNMAPSEYRIRVMEAVFSGKLNKSDIAALRKSLDAVVAKHKDPTGFSGINAAEPAGYKSVDMDSTDYNVVGGYSSADMQKVLDKLYTKEVKGTVDGAMKAMQALHKATRELDKESNYWSKPVQSVVDFYGWDNYIPLKGKQKYVGRNDDMLDFDGPRLGKDYQDAQNPFEGRKTDSDNSLLQSMVDATRAAMRAGRKDVTLAIKNAVNDKLLFGKVVAENVPFADRYKIPNMKTKDGVPITGPNFVFHYKPDGSIDVIQLSDRDQREAIKRTYQDSQPLIDLLNTATSTVGMLHTRYNIAFAPMNFVRDALTNAFTMGADMGPKVAAQYIGAIAAKVATGGMRKAFTVAQLYERGKFDEIEKLAQKDPYVAAMYAYIQEGGKVSYLQGISSRSQQQELQRDIKSSSPKKALAAINKVLDIWVDTFELASRTAAYEITKSQEMTKGLDEEAASKKAAGYAKRLANFEEVGDWGRAAGAMFMFFRPAATGAVRAIEALEPAFRSVESAMADLPQKIREDKAAVEKFKKEYEERKANARVMSLGLLGLGAAVYAMAYMLADDDDQGRNRVATDDPSRWSRYARFFIPGFETPVQIPWGFGLGAFAATGAQIASIGLGQTTVKEALTNTALIGLDSFLPLPVSRINPLEQPAAWAMDSSLPSIMRPFLEWTMNVDGLGREIYNNRQSRYGDAYTGGDNIPEVYKAAARMLYGATDGAADVSPNTLYFFANNYLDGLTRLGAGVANVGMVATGEKEFNPKTDTLVFDSFFGAPSNVDARQFSNAEKRIEDIKKRLKTLQENHPEKYVDYIEKNPMHLAAVEMYDQQVNQTLRDLREQANRFRRMPDLSVKERTDLVKSVVGAQNLVKRNILNMMDAFELDY